MPELTINDAVHHIEDGVSILEALQRVGIEVPHVCHDPRLAAVGDCRLCSVEVAGEPRPVVSCQRRIEPGMRIRTHTDALEAFRRTMLELLAVHCSAASLAAHPAKEFHRLLRRYGVVPAAAADGAAQGRGVDESHPHIRVDMSQCIGCYRCVRICEELQGQSVWHVLGRGADSQVVFDRGERFVESSCVSCGACVDTCPTGALTDRSPVDAAAAVVWTRTTCGYCGTGCEMQVGSVDNRIVAVAPVLSAPVSKGHLCSKGRYAWNFGSAADRVTAPMLRRQGLWSPVSWHEALAHTVSTLQRLAAEHGPDCIGVLGSARATNEDNYLLQKFARLAIGTNNVDCCARVCHTPTAAAMKRMLGTGAATNSFDDIERAQSFMIVGANPTENHPIVGARIKQRVIAGVPLIVIDPRRTELAAYAAVHLALRPGTNIPLLHALAHVLLAEHLVDANFIAQRVEGLEPFQRFVAAWTPERAAHICGVASDDIRAAARLYARCAPSMCFHGLGVTEHLQGTEGVMALVNLALLTGNLGRPGSGVNPLRGQNNVQGAAVMGCEPQSLTGSAPIEEARARFEAAWDAPLPRTRGMHLLEMMDAAEAGRLKALYIVGYDIAMSLADANRVRGALERLELVIVQDLFMTETASACGSVFLPVASSLEKEGTFMNAERRIQRVRQVLPPPAEARADWQIVRELARRYGVARHFEADSPAAIWEEIRSVWPAVAGIDYARMEQGGIQWPCPDAAHPGSSVLHQEAFGRSRTAKLECIDYVPSDEQTSSEFPFLLITGRTLHQFNAGTMIARTPNHQLRPEDTLDISAADAASLGLSTAERVRVRSPYGEAVLPLRVSASMKVGELFATFHDAHRGVNRLTSAVRDRLVGAPEYKLTAVRLEPVAGGGPPDRQAAPHRGN